jgi:hypothetical protein
MANLCTAADILIIAPEFQTVPINTVDRFIEMASNQINDLVWGQKAKYGAIYLAAHLMTLNGLGVTGASYGDGTDGAHVTMKTVGQVSVQYQPRDYNSLAIAGGDALLGTTRYGIEFARLKKQGAFGALVT